MNVRFRQGKVLSLMCALLLAVKTLHAQMHLTEYYFDTDPGYGNASYISYPATRDTTFTLPVGTASLTNGLHRIFVRTHDTLGHWSQSTAGLFYKEAFQSNPLQNITAAEYFIDTDPGYGAGAAIAVGTGNAQSLSFAPMLTGLANGLHRLVVRTQDAAGRWSLGTLQLFYNSAVQTNPLVNIVKAEYFFDTDPGFGNGNNVALTAGAAINIAFNGAISGLTDGMHRLVVRTQDANGKWGQSAPQLFYKGALVTNSPASITRAEYYFDTDPGFGSATDITVTPGGDFTFAFNGSITALSNGLHRLNIRTQDANGRWSISMSQLFYKQDIQSNALVNIDQAEYFFDTDPGFGNAINVPVTAGSNITFAINGNIAPLNDGLHLLYVRTHDVNGKWSTTTPQLFIKQPAPPPAISNISKAEYFVDADPGFGLATDVPVTPATTLTFSFSPGISSLTNGLHRLVVRTCNGDGKWSMSATQLFYKEALQGNSLVNIVKAEYFFDTDPGFGSGNDVPVAAGSMVTINFSSGISGLSNGLHRLYLRSRDINGKWSNSTPQLFYKGPVQNNPAVAIVKAEYFFDTDPGFDNANDVLVTPGLDITFTFAGAATALSPGIHRLYVRTKDANGKWSLAIPQVLYKEAVQNNPLVAIDKAEYYFDADPGYGAGTAIVLTSGSDITINLTGSITALSKGLHRLYIRSHDVNGKWSMSVPRLFFNERIETHVPGNLVSIEYFWDTEPGFGAATGVPLPAGNTQLSNFNFSAAIPQGMSATRHNLYVRVLDDWSLTTVKVVDFTGIALPVTLLEFSANKQREQVSLNWVVNNESNMERYEAERSTDGKVFSTLGNRKALELPGELKYNLLDEHPAEGINYYRIRQIDRSGTFVYSPVVSVLFSTGADEVKIFPNPTRQFFMVESKGKAEEVLMTDLEGKVIQRWAGNAAQYALNPVATGMYLIRVVMANHRTIVKNLLIKE